MRILSILVLLGLAWGQTLLTFQSPGPLRADEGVEVLSYAEDSPAVLVTAKRAGRYRVCLGEECQTFEIPPRRNLFLRPEVLPPNLVLGELRVRLRSESNLPLRLRLWAEGRVTSPAQFLEILPGEEKEVELPLSGYGEFRLRVGGDLEQTYVLRRPPPDGHPDPYRLQGNLELGHGGLGLGLKGNLSPWVGLELSLQGAFQGVLWLGEPPNRLGLGFEEGPYLVAKGEGKLEEVDYTLSLKGRLGGGEVGLGLRYPPFSLALGFGDGGAKGEVGWWEEGFGLALGWQGGAWGRFSFPGGYLEAREGRLSLAYASWTLRLEEGGFALGFREGRLYGEVGLLRDSPRVSLGAILPWPGGEPGYLALGVGWGPDLRVQLSLERYLGEGTWLAGGLTRGGGNASLRGRSGELEWRLASPFPTLRPKLNLGFPLDVPIGVTEVLGGWKEGVPKEGQVLLRGKPLPGARVVSPLAVVETDGEGRYRVWAPREASLRVLPPPGVLALEGETEGGVVELRPAGRLDLSCPAGVWVRVEPVGFYPCGPLLLPPGQYRVVGLGKEEEVELLPGEEKALALTPRPPEAPKEAEPLEVLYLDLPEVLTPGTVELLALGEVLKTPWGDFPVVEGRVRLEIPEELEGDFPVLLLGKEGSREYVLRVRKP